MLWWYHGTYFILFQLYFLFEFVFQQLLKNINPFFWISLQGFFLISLVWDYHDILKNRVQNDRKNFEYMKNSNIFTLHWIVIVRKMIDQEFRNYFCRSLPVFIYNLSHYLHTIFFQSAQKSGGEKKICSSCFRKFRLYLWWTSLAYTFSSLSIFYGLIIFMRCF